MRFFTMNPLLTHKEGQAQAANDRQTHFALLFLLLLVALAVVL